MNGSVDRISAWREGWCRESITVFHVRHGQVWVRGHGRKLPFYHFSIGYKLSYNLQAKELSLCFLKVFSVEFKLLSP